MIRLVLALLVALVGVSALAWAVGLFLPDRRVVRLRTVFPRPVDDLWGVLTGGRVGLEVREAEERRRLTAERPGADRGDGRWTFLLEGTADGCALTIEQERPLGSPLRRSLAALSGGGGADVVAFRDRIGRELERGA